MIRAIPLILLAFAVLLIPMANASYTVVHFNVTLNLNKNTSAQVTEIYTVLISNSSVNQYSTTNRFALNLTLSDWENLVGPSLVEHIINPSSSIYNFKFIPGPATYTGNYNSTAYMLLTYTVSNVTVVNQTAPRIFEYTFQPKVFNFEHGTSGQFLNPGATLTINLPSGAKVQSVYPIPDSPPAGVTNNYANVTSMSWYSTEPLSKFSLAFVTTESIQAEVIGFFTAIYRALGVFTYVIIAAVVIGFILYTYFRTGGK